MPFTPFFLKITDKEVEKQYIYSRKKEQIIISASVLAMRLIVNSVIFAVNVNKQTTKYNDYSVAASRWVAVALNMLLIFLTWKFPLKLCEFHGPIVTLLYLPTVILNN